MKEFRGRIFDMRHLLTHLVADATTKMVSITFEWPSIKKDCKLWCQQCLPCQHVKVSTQLTTHIWNTVIKYIHIDIIVPLPASMRYRYCLTCTYRFTQWLEAIPMVDITVETVALTFLTAYISQFDVPIRVTTDSRRSFNSDLFMSRKKCFLSCCKWNFIN